MSPTLHSVSDIEPGFRDRFAQLLGSPSTLRPDDECIVMSWVKSPLGLLVAGASTRGICLLEFSNRQRLETQVATLRQRFQCRLVGGDHVLLDQLSDELGRYFAGALTAFTLPLHYPGTEFQRRVWDALRRIPYGETRSYNQLARELDSPGASRAVGHANGLNRVAIVIPCHRVVNTDGKLGGYGGGLWRKQYLLDLEQGNPRLPVDDGSSGVTSD
jgi:AraC family transcriptional regulator of adaptative response/methylated-DNA-[protein]-cysteine methyltransferase